MRADSACWQRTNPVIPDGEPVIERTAAGSVRIKIGNGTDRYSALPSLLGDAVKASGSQIQLAGGKSFRLGTVPALHLSLPKIHDEDFFCEVSFDSGVDATEFSTSEHIRFSGDGVADEELMPIAKTHYTLFIWYDGSFQGIVRGIPNE
jgi:hypothetical protein